MKAAVADGFARLQNHCDWDGIAAFSTWGVAENIPRIVFWGLNTDHIIGVCNVLKDGLFVIVHVGGVGFIGFATFAPLNLLDFNPNSLFSVSGVRIANKKLIPDFQLSELNIHDSFLF
jgi:hypothetical protein